MPTAVEMLESGRPTAVVPQLRPGPCFPRQIGIVGGTRVAAEFSVLSAGAAVIPVTPSRRYGTDV
jgi:hypothetical protein